MTWPSKIRFLGLTYAHKDNTLSSLLSLLAHRNYTVIYTTSPKLSPGSSSESNKESEYEMASSSEPFFNTDLKRDLQGNLQKRLDNNVTLVDGPLFERYQFLTPGKSANPKISRRSSVLA